jgi:hypothetical protein
MNEMGGEEGRERVDRKVRAHHSHPTCPLHNLENGNPKVLRFLPSDLGSYVSSGVLRPVRIIGRCHPTQWWPV